MKRHMSYIPVLNVRRVLGVPVLCIDGGVPKSEDDCNRGHFSGTKAVSVATDDCSMRPIVVFPSSLLFFRLNRQVWSI
jgi:hypothetical protein